jgi:hypothetical protein
MFLNEKSSGGPSIVSITYFLGTCEYDREL